MNIKQNFIGAFALGTASVLAMSATPAAAAVSAAPSASPVTSIETHFPSPLAGIGGPGADEAVEYGRRFRRRRFRPFRRRRGLSAGDLLTGALIIGGIAVVADAINDNNRNTRTYPRRNRNRTVQQPVPQPRSTRSTSDINVAADQCAFAAEERYGNGAQVSSINRIERADNGFNVQGTIAIESGQDSFSCGVIGGEIQYLEFGRGQQLLEDQ